ATGQSHFDQEGISTIYRRRPRRRAEELPRHLVVQSLEDEWLTDGRDAVGRWSADPRVLNRLIQSLDLLAADAARTGSAADLRGFANLLRQAGADARKRAGQELRHRAGAAIFKHRHELAQLDPIRMGFDLLGLGRKL